MTVDFLISELADLIIEELKTANYCTARGIKSKQIKANQSKSNQIPISCFPTLFPYDLRPARFIQPGIESLGVFDS
jgi:hypothetical protein